jgi:hypothetical protein
MLVGEVFVYWLACIACNEGYKGNKTKAYIVETAWVSGFSAASTIFRIDSHGGFEFFNMFLAVIILCQ